MLPMEQMVKIPKCIQIILWGVIIAFLFTSQVGRSTQVVATGGSGVSSGAVNSPVSADTVSIVLNPDYQTTAKMNLNANKPAKLASLGAILPAGTHMLTGPPGDAQDWVLTFSDEFNGETLNANKWAKEYGLDTYCIVDNPPPPGTPTYCNRSNNDEKNWYVDESPQVEAGVLKLVASKNDCSGDGLPDRNYAPYTCANFPYLSGMVSTHDRFSQLYGYFEARIKSINGQGFWPSFWLIPQLPPLPNPTVGYFWPPEIDIMENKGQVPNEIYMTQHYSGVYPLPSSKLNNWTYGGHEGAVFNGPDYSAGFHTYAVEWQPGLVIWYIDGIEHFRSIFNTPPGTINQPDYSGEMHLILNLAVGGVFVDHLLPPDQLLPATMEVDYVHVYQKASLPLAEFTTNSPVDLGETAVFTNSSIGPEPLSFVWYFGNTFTSTLRNPTHSFADIGPYTVILTATNVNGSDSVSHDFVVWNRNNTIFLPWFTKK